MPPHQARQRAEESICRKFYKNSTKISKNIPLPDLKHAL